MRLFSKAEVV